MVGSVNRGGLGPADHAVLAGDAEVQDGPRAWDRRRYDDLVARLGSAKVERHLAAVVDTFRRVMDQLLADPENAKQLAWEAHALVSPAGVLGFEDLTTACRQVQIVGTAASCRTLSLALAASIERALSAMPAGAARAEGSATVPHSRTASA